MDYYSLSDQAIEEEIGSRIKSLRLRKNITQKTLSELTALSYATIQRLEYGSGSSLSTLIAVLRELASLDEIGNFIPPISVSPLQLAKMQGRKRQRASGKRLKGYREFFK